MTNPYGPWATAIDAGRNPQLSAFWRQRLTMLVPASQTSPFLSRRNLLGLVAAAALICVLPTFRAAPAVAENEEAGQPPAAKQDTDIKTVRGKVIDESGKPVQGADLWLRVFTAKGENVWHANSDSQGRFTLEAPAAGVAEMLRWNAPATLSALAAGHQLGTRAVWWPERASDVEVRLGPATGTSFVVLDPAGRPCSGVFVAPQLVDEKDCNVCEPLPKGMLSSVGAQTDAQGRVKLPAVSRDLLRQVRITTADFGIQLSNSEESEPPASLGQTIRLRTVGRIEGRLFGSRPEILKGARVILVTKENRGIHALPPMTRPEPPTEGFAQLECDENGRFRVPALAAGRLEIGIFVDETQPLRPKLPDSLEVKAGETALLWIPMAPSVVLRGSIRARIAANRSPLRCFASRMAPKASRPMLKVMHWANTRRACCRARSACRWSMGKTT